MLDVTISFKRFIFFFHNSGKIQQHTNRDALKFDEPYLLGKTMKWHKKKLLPQFFPIYNLEVSSVTKDEWLMDFESRGNLSQNEVHQLQHRRHNK